MILKNCISRSYQIITRMLQYSTGNTVDNIVIMCMVSGGYLKCQGHHIVKYATV